MRRHWKTIGVLAIVAVLGLSVVAVAWGAGTGRSGARRTAACRTLMGNPQAVKEMGTLRAEHQKDMRAWYGKYGADPSSTEARAAMQTLRQSHWNDMKALFKKYGIKVPAGAGAGACGGPGGMMGAGGSCGGGGCGGQGVGTDAQGAGYGFGMMGSGGGMMGGQSY
ncbi:MAG: hypothetical protein WCN81_05995 [Actinomycetes bacterium]